MQQRIIPMDAPLNLYSFSLGVAFRSGSTPYQKSFPAFSGTTSSKFTVLIRHGRNMASTWRQLRPRPPRPQPRPNLDPLGSMLGPTCCSLGAISAHLAPHGLNTGDMAGPQRNCQVFVYRRGFVSNNVSCCVSVGPNLARSWHETAPHQVGPSTSGSSGST